VRNFTAEKKLEDWNDGKMEYWESIFFSHHSIIPLFHSYIPI